MRKLRRYNGLRKELKRHRSTFFIDLITGQLYKNSTGTATCRQFTVSTPNIHKAVLDRTKQCWVISGQYEWYHNPRKVKIIRIPAELFPAALSQYVFKQLGV